jgi:hypothetical protein
MSAIRHWWEHLSWSQAACVELLVILAGLAIYLYLDYRAVKTRV